MQIALYCTMELPGSSNQHGCKHFDVGQPRFYGCYFVAPTGETQVEAKVETQTKVKEEVRVLPIASLTCSWRNVSEEIAQYARDAWRKSKLAQYGATLAASPC